MTHEEKLAEAKRLYKTANADQRYVLESLFPELAESEDKKIRKAIIKFLIDVNNGAYTKSELEIASWIAWLEKQGEQKQRMEEQQ